MKGKQKRLILLAKKEMTWKELSQKTNIPQGYLCNDLKSEKRLLKRKDYQTLCSISKENFNKFILEKLKENWGKSKGGKNSLGSTKKIKIPQKSNELAEIVGAILGDGNLNYYKKGKKIGVYQVRIAGDLEKDREYHLNYLLPLISKLFKIIPKEVIYPHERFIAVYSKELVEFFKGMGINAGDKILNQSTIPKWIIKSNEYTKSCLRGLIDTDGCIHKMSNKDPHLLRINFTNHNHSLITDTRKAFQKLGFHPSKIILNHNFYISRKAEVERYLKEIGFSNPKHIQRLQSLR